MTIYHQQDNCKRVISYRLSFRKWAAIKVTQLKKLFVEILFYLVGETVSAFLMNA